jgi:hypothetical protein
VLGITRAPSTISLSYRVTAQGLYKLTWSPYLSVEIIDGMVGTRLKSQIEVGAEKCRAELALTPGTRLGVLGLSSKA